MGIGVNRENLQQKGVKWIPILSGKWLHPFVQPKNHPLLIEEFPNNHLGCKIPFKEWDKLPNATG